jgi:hypothetical protein
MDEITNAEELQAMIEADERADSEWLKPREFAKMIGVAPQLVYYYIRTEKIESIKCLCGSRVINAKQAREVFESRGQQISKDPEVD